MINIRYSSLEYAYVDFPAFWPALCSASHDPAATDICWGGRRPRCGTVYEDNAYFIYRGKPSESSGRFESHLANHDPMIGRVGQLFQDLPCLNRLLHHI